MCSVKIIREYESIKKLPERQQFILPANESYASSVCSKSARSRLTSRADTPNSLQLLDDLSSPYGYSIPLQIETGNSLTRSDYDQRHNAIYNASLPILQQSHQFLTSSSNSLVPYASFKIYVQDLNDNVTSIEVDEKTLSCEVIDFFTLIESICQEGVRISMKNAADIAFSKNLLLDSFSALKTHIRILKSTYYKLKELDRNSYSGNSGKQQSNSLIRQSVTNHDQGSLSDRSDRSYRSNRSIDRSEVDSYADDKDKERLKRQLQSKKFECEKLSKKIQILIEELNDLKPHAEKSAELEIENSEMKRSLRTVQNRSDHLSDEVRQLTRRLQGKDQTIEESQNELIEIQKKLDKMSTERQRENSERMLIQAELDSVRNNLVAIEEELKNKLFDSECTISDKNFEIKSLQDKFEKLERKVEELKETNSRESVKTQEFENKVNQLYIEIERKENSINDLTEHNILIQAERDMLKDKISSLQKNVDELINDNKHLKYDLHNRRTLFDKSREELSLQLEGAVGAGNSTANYSPSASFRPHAYSSLTSLNTSDSIGRIHELQSKLRSSLSEQSRLKMEEATIEKQSQQRIDDLTKRLQESEASVRRLNERRSGQASPAPTAADIPQEFYTDYNDRYRK